MFIPIAEWESFSSHERKSSCGGVLRNRHNYWRGRTVVIILLCRRRGMPRFGRISSFHRSSRAWESVGCVRTARKAALFRRWRPVTTILRNFKWFVDDVSKHIAPPFAREGFRAHASHSNSLHTVIKRRTRPPEESRWQLQLGCLREIKSLLKLVHTLRARLELRTYIHIYSDWLRKRCAISILIAI